ncbi:MAG TPA: SAM-dependent chlorinase/fluorinase [Pseudonocardiaceae bacterium]|nr:SAM-dependent chlorinase/fluorinase [Pseudonocardiaceae bacterium]
MGFDWISFTTDYGTSDAFVGICKGVIAGIAPHARVLDVTHAIGPQDVRRGASVLASAMPYLPAGVHVAVVDPGVGTARRGVIVVAGASVLVGPDNGLLLPAAAALGGVTGCFELSEPRFRLPAVSATFHGRDIFAPAAAHLANGEQPAAFGAEVDPGELVRLPEPALRVGDGVIEAEVVGVDHFGNVQLAGGADALAAVGASGDRVIVEFGRSEHAAVVGRTFGDVPLGGLLVHVDSAGAVAIAVNGGSAAAVLGGEGRLGGEGARTGGLGGAGAGVAGVGVGGIGGAGAVLVVRRG